MNVTREKLEDVRKELEMTEGFDVCLEMSGAPSCLKDIIDNSRNGANISLLGIHSPMVPSSGIRAIFTDSLSFSEIWYCFFGRVTFPFEGPITLAINFPLCLMKVKDTLCSTQYLIKAGLHLYSQM